LLSLVFVFFVLLIHSPLNSTLFPYTTLFRSRYVHEVVWHDYNVLLVGHHNVVAMNVGTVRIAQLSALRMHIRTVRRKRPNGPRPDRKSTRLNSSHVSISYAVFCLKKNKNTYI